MRDAKDGTGDDPAGGDGTARASARLPEQRPASLLDRFRSNQLERLKAWWPWLLLAAILFAGGWFLVKPAPPGTIVIATGRKDGAYHGFAERYAKTFTESRVTLEIRETAGAVENFRLLSDPNSGVSVAIVQGGSAPDGLPDDLRSIASLYLEPTWVFYRGQAGQAGPEPSNLSDLRGKRIAVGPEGSGTRAIALRLLAANGIATRDAPAGSPGTGPAATEPADVVTLHEQAGVEAAEALKAGGIDAALFVIPPGSPIVQDLLRAEREHGIRLLSFERHEAYARIFPFVSDVKLPRGVIDLRSDLPARDVNLIAPVANLVAREDLHPAIVALLVRAAMLAHERGDLLSSPGTFPNTQFIELPMDPAAREYFRSGQPFLQRYLPFWMAALVDRMKILLLPLITLVIPLVRVAPPLYVWRIRSRIYRWYRVIRDVDQKLRTAPADGPAAPDLARELSTIAELEREIGEVKVPLSYMEEFYNLRLHTDFIRRKLEERLHGGDVAANTSSGERG